MVSADGPDFLAIPLLLGSAAGRRRAQRRTRACAGASCAAAERLIESRCGVHHASMLSGRHAYGRPVVSSADSARGCIALTEACRLATWVGEGRRVTSKGFLRPTDV